MNVVSYSPKYKQDFIDLNVAWIDDMFELEPEAELAIHLCRKLGFVDMPVDKKKFPFKRADLAFELCFNSKVS